MKTYKGKNAAWLIGIFVIYNILPIIFCLNDDKIISNFWWIMMWVFYYSCNIIWIPVFIRNYIKVYDEYFIFYYGFSKERFAFKDILKIEKSRNLMASIG